MATVTVKHATKTRAPADPLALVDGATWDSDPHVVTGLENVDNTSDVNKPVSTAQATADALVASNAATATALKANIASPTLTGTPAAPTAAPGTATTQLATTAFVDAARVILVAVDALKAPLASPTLTGTPAAPTASVSTNTTQLATTAFVLGQLATVAPLIDGAAAVGTSTLMARQDHVHPGVANGQLPGTATNDNASAGNIGEYIESKATNGTATVTITNASPGVISWTGHGLNIGSPVNFTTTGGLPTGLTVGVNYYVCSTSFGANSFTVATSVANALAGTPVNTSSAGSGTQTAISNVVQTTSTAVNVTGISLTAGDWDIEFDAQFTGNTTTVVSSFGASVSLSSATIDTTNGRTDGRYVGGSAIYNGFALGVFPSARTGALRFSLNATTTIFGVVESTFSTSTSSAFGLMRARRVR